jgi:hypothetical protein
VSSELSSSVVSGALKEIGDYKIIKTSIITLISRMISTFYPIIAAFSLITTVTIFVQRNSGLPFDFHKGMRHFMAGFFLFFSAFKLQNLRAFVNSFASYDILAERSRLYGFIYPFIELALGVAYLTNRYMLAVNAITLALMTFSSLGVYRALRLKRKLTCACLGTLFKLPMTYFTLFEDLLMAAMALAALIYR